MGNLLDGLAGGALVGIILTFIQFLINRSDQKKEKGSAILKAIEELGDRLKGVEKRMDKEGADEARRNILIFDDELRRSIEHSEESFDQVLDDITYYSHYCRDHPEYENNKAVNAIQHIEHVYQQVKAENKFI